MTFLSSFSTSITSVDIRIPLLSCFSSKEQGHTACPGILCAVVEDGREGIEHTVTGACIAQERAPVPMQMHPHTIPASRSDEQQGHHQVVLWEGLLACIALACNSGKSSFHTSGSEKEL